MLNNEDFYRLKIGQVVISDGMRATITRLTQISGMPWISLDIGASTEFTGPFFSVRQTLSFVDKKERDSDYGNWKRYKEYRRWAVRYRYIKIIVSKFLRGDCEALEGSLFGTKGVDYQRKTGRKGGTLWS
jgi:hypothetical protein